MQWSSRVFPARGRARGYVWGALAVVVCPCHLPLIIGALAGTTAGAMLSSHWVLGLAGLVCLFLLAAVQAWRGLSAATCDGCCAGPRDGV